LQHPTLRPDRRQGVLSGIEFPSRGRVMWREWLITAFGQGLNKGGWAKGGGGLRVRGRPWARRFHAPRRAEGRPQHKLSLTLCRAPFLFLPQPGHSTKPFGLNDG